MTPTQHIQCLLSEISKGLYEKDHILSLALLCAVSGESYFLLGPPGTAKSEIARRLKLVFKDATAFEYLMSRFSTPDEIFGPVSIQKLKSEDTYERKVDGFLPSADIVFLDEIWKAGPAIQNSLLTVINEKIYLNGTTTLHVPMKCLIAASNELPAEGEGLEALWDRFLVRVVSNCISTESEFLSMFVAESLPNPSIKESELIDEKILLEWQKSSKSVQFPTHILKSIAFIRQKMRAQMEAKDCKPQDYYISDRRWRRVASLLRMSAFLNGRNEVDYSDLQLLFSVLWNKPATMNVVYDLLAEAIFLDILNMLHELESNLKIEDETQSAQASTNTEQYTRYHSFYMKVENFPDGLCYFWEPDYKYLPTSPSVNGILYYDHNLDARIIRSIDRSKPFDTAKYLNVQRVKLRRSAYGILIDEVGFKFECKNKQERASLFDDLSPTKQLQDAIEQRCTLLLSNIFTPKDAEHQLLIWKEKLVKRIDMCDVLIHNNGYNYYG